jgi:hypothetical protein
MWGGVMEEMFPECWPECVAEVLFMSEMWSPEDPLVFMWGGVMEEMFPEC